MLKSFILLSVSVSCVNFQRPTQYGYSKISSVWSFIIKKKNQIHFHKVRSHNFFLLSVIFQSRKIYSHYCKIAFEGHLLFYSCNYVCYFTVALVNTWRYEMVALSFPIPWESSAKNHLEQLKQPAI